MEWLQLLKFRNYTETLLRECEKTTFSVLGSQLSRPLGLDGESLEQLREPDGSLPKAYLRRGAIDG